MDLVLGAAMNPLLDKLQPYPFARLRQLFADVTANPVFRPISLGIGEPKHATPSFIKDALSGSLDALAVYPATAGELPLREAFTGWVRRRYGLALDAATQVLPVNGSREALFALAQTVVDPTRRQPAPVRRKPGRAHRRPPEAAALRAVQGCAGSLGAAALSPSGGGGEASGGLTSAPVVVSPNPFYQIYEGAALLAGADTWYAASDPARNFAVDWDSVPAGIWARTQLVYVCSPGNPTGAVMPLEEWRKLFALSDRHGFVIASDECYSEIYFRDEPPLGALQAAAQLGRKDFRNLIALTSLSKRSNVPGLRSGFVAGDAAIIKSFLLYRTYHGSAMSGTVAAASIAAWGDESHVVDNRAQYRTKFAAVTPLLEPVLDVRLPDASFYLWAGVPPAWNGDDPAFARALYAQYNVTVLPGSYLAREVSDQNPGAGRIRMALVADTAECIEAAQRIVQFIHKPIA